MLGDAIDHGLSLDVALSIEADPDFESLRSNPGFTAITADIVKRAPVAAQMPK
jgi:hypothetical protein